MPFGFFKRGASVRKPEKIKPRPVVFQPDDNEPTSNCPACKRELRLSQLWGNDHCCPYCDHHFRMNARQRIAFFTDADSFSELDYGLISADALNFPGFAEKLEKTRHSSGESEGVVCGTARINGEETALFIMDPFFMMASMGVAVGEKITRLFEYAAEKRLPVIGVTASGGARMQEGLLSLMQMAKTSAAVRRHSDAGLLYIVLLTDPTTGGVSASFAMQGDVMLAEPGATIGFAGARVIEQAANKKLPQGFQTSEFLLQHGFVDRVVPRHDQRRVLSLLIRMHNGGNRYGR